MPQVNWLPCQKMVSNSRARLLALGRWCYGLELALDAPNFKRLYTWIANGELEKKF